MIRDYIELALKKATYEKLEDGSYSGEIVECPGTIAFGETKEECQEELESALEDWFLSALHHGDTLPTLDGMDLNKRIEAIHE